MKTTVLSLAVMLAASSVSAQDIRSAVDMNAVKAYVTRLLPRCPGATVAFDPIPGRGPSGFHAYRAVMTSSDEHCTASKFILYSPLTQQTIVGSIIALPGGEQPVHVRIGEHTSKMLNAGIKATIAPLLLPDGLRQVQLGRSTEYGPFAYTGYLDQSERFLIVGLRGRLDEDPAVTLRRAIGADSAARRGNGAAKIEIIEVSDFQCPTCSLAHESLEPLIASNLGKIRYTRIDLPLFEAHKWAVPAAMGARAIHRVAPAKYWSYVDAVFKSQETLNEKNIDKFIQDWAADNDVKWASLAKIYSSNAERTALLESVSQLFGAGINSTPTFIVNGQILGYGSGGYALDFIKQALAAK